ncbi:MAG TPA: DinB family protein [Dehalococcoidia bacterium]|nr:DinB family protein [Dehalococcoidia bacterium]
MDERETIIREQILGILRGGHAHMPFAEAVKDFPMDDINKPFPNGSYSAWGLLEHVRITQWDILDFSRNPGYKYIKWPEDYWPGTGKTATPEDWRKTCEAFESDMKELEALLMDPKTDLYAKIAWGEGQTILREMLVVADHNAYHLGELAIMRQVMNNWGPDHQ